MTDFNMVIPQSGGYCKPYKLLIDPGDSITFAYNGRTRAFFYAAPVDSNDEDLKGSILAGVSGWDMGPGSNGVPYGMPATKVFGPWDAGYTLRCYDRLQPLQETMGYIIVSSKPQTFNVVITRGRGGLPFSDGSGYDPDFTARAGDKVNFAYKDNEAIQLVGRLRDNHGNPVSEPGGSGPWILSPGKTSPPDWSIPEHWIGRGVMFYSLEHPDRKICYIYVVPPYGFYGQQDGN